MLLHKYMFKDQRDKTENQNADHSKLQIGAINLE